MGANPGAAPPAGNCGMLGIIGIWPTTDGIEGIKKWFDQVNIKYYEGSINLQWTKIMSHINSDPESFFKREGGWAFLEAEQSDDELDELDQESRCVCARARALSVLLHVHGACVRPGVILSARLTSTRWCSP